MKRIRVLCAMRDGRVIRELRRALEARCEFDMFADGATALEHALREPPDILVADAVLPMLDGTGLIERMRAALGERMPRVIGGSVGGFAEGELVRAGADCTLAVPWRAEALQCAIEEMVEALDTQVDWGRAQRACEAAGRLLRLMGMSEKLRGFTFLSWAAALACMDEDRLHAIGARIYAPIAQRESAAPQTVERLIRHAVERMTDTVGEAVVYTFFGNTIDPMRGKPTNAQMIAMLAQRIRVCGNREAADEGDFPGDKYPKKS